MVNIIGDGCHVNGADVLPTQRRRWNSRGFAAHGLRGQRMQPPHVLPASGLGPAIVIARRGQSTELTRKSYSYQRWVKTVDVIENANLIDGHTTYSGSDTPWLGRWKLGCVAQFTSLGWFPPAFGYVDENPAYPPVAMLMATTHAEYLDAPAWWTVGHEYAPTTNGAVLGYLRANHIDHGVITSDVAETWIDPFYYITAQVTRYTYTLETFTGSRWVETEIE